MSQPTFDPVKFFKGAKKICEGMEDVCVGVQKLGEEVPKNKEKIGANEQSIKELKTTTEKHGTDIETIEKETLKESVANGRFSKKSEVEPLAKIVKKLENEAPNHASKESVRENASKISSNSDNIDINSGKIKKVESKVDNNASRITTLETDLKKNYLNKVDAAVMYTPLKTSTSHEDRISSLEKNTMTTETAKSTFATVSSASEREKEIRDIQQNYVKRTEADKLYSPAATADNHAGRIKNLEDGCLTKADAEKQFLRKTEHAELQKDLTTWKEQTEKERDEDRNEIDALQVKVDDLTIFNKMLQIRMKAAEDHQTQQTAIICHRAVENMNWANNSLEKIRKRKADVQAYQRKSSRKKCRRGGRGKGGKGNGAKETSVNNPK